MFFCGCLKSNNCTKKLSKIEEEAIQAAQAGDFDKARALMFDQNYNDTKTIITGLIDEFTNAINEMAAEQVAETSAQSKLLFTIVYIFLGLLISMLLITFALLAKKVRSLVVITKRLDELATNDGDLTSRVDITSKDEIGDIAKSFNTFVEKVRDIVVEIARISEQVAASSEQLTATTHQSSVAAEEVARTIEDIAKGASDQAKDTENGAANINILGEIIEEDLRLISNLESSSNKVMNLIEEVYKVVPVKDCPNKRNPS